MSAPIQLKRILVKSCICCYHGSLNFHVNKINHQTNNCSHSLQTWRHLSLTLMMKTKLIVIPLLVRGQDWSCSEKRETVSGKTCQRWDTNSPHRVDFSPSAPWHNNCCRACEFVNSLLLNSSEYWSEKIGKERVLNKSLADDPGAHWCYTTDPEIERELCEDNQNQKSTERGQSCDW